MSAQYPVSPRASICSVISTDKRRAAGLLGSGPLGWEILELDLISQCGADYESDSGMLSVS